MDFNWTQYDKDKHLKLLLEQNNESGQTENSIELFNYSSLMTNFINLRLLLSVYEKLFIDFNDNKLSCENFCSNFKKLDTLSRDITAVFEAQLIVFGETESSYYFGLLLGEISEICDMFNSKLKLGNKESELYEKEFKKLMNKLLLDIQVFFE